MLDLFSDLGLAGNIVQFIDFASKLVSKNVELYRSSSGEPTEYTLEQAILDLRNLSDGLIIQYSSSKLGGNGGIANVALACKSEAKKFSVVLDRVQIKHGSHQLQSVHQALANEWRKKEIEEFRTNLMQLQTQLLLHLLKSTNDRQSSFANDMKELRDESMKMNMNASYQLDRLASTIHELKELIIEILNSDFDTANATKTLEYQKRDDAIAHAKFKLKDIDLVLLRELGFERGKEGEAFDVSYDASILQKILSTLHSVVSRGSTLLFEQEILRSLKFEEMRMRESNIARAHLKTFDWILESQTITGDNNSRNHFLHWLRNESGIFWLSGKPGSGKSTLMRYLVNHPNTNRHLRTWASHQTLVTGSFFFWNSGTAMQKSQQGLLQSLLFEVLRQCPFLIETTFPERWMEWQGERGGHHFLRDWTIDDLKAGLKQLMQADTNNAKFCFFIDGLDEYDGYSADIIEILDDFTASPNIKLCLSSRHWPAFQTAYGNSARSLKLQDLTRDDIRLYVRERLAEYESSIAQRNEDPQPIALIEEIVGNAEGVFLWVVLVVQWLREGILNADPISVLTKRLRELPSDLAAFFRHILRQVDKVYWAGTTQAFEMAFAGDEQLPLWFQSVLDDESLDTVIQAKVKPLSNFEVDKIHGCLEKRLNARCKGLLEVVTINSDSDIFSTKKVDFLHRTVRDSLQLDNIKDLLAQRLEAPFDPNLAICTGLLAQAKAASTFETSVVQNIVRDFLLYHARIRDTIHGETSSKLLQDMIATIERASHPSGQSPSLVTLSLDSSLVSLSLDPLTVWRYYIHYMEQKLAGATTQLISRQAAERLEIALTPIDAKAKLSWVNPILIRLILEDGADLNHEVDDATGGSIWVRFLELISRQTPPSYEEQNTWFQIVDMMVRYHANLDALVKVGDRDFSAETVISRIRRKQSEKSGNYFLSLVSSVLRA
ncbi:hypothetical protein EG329_013845 [Mollisiaceae sp. DMI_Dod_QoI]|nr:hypothetical protein EG329_013845 [Helotiales sp. DMI_Dod_QoI]